MQQAAMRERRRVYTNMTCLSSDFVRRQVDARMRSEQLWRELRAKDDWAGFLPAFEGVVAIAARGSRAARRRARPRAL